MESLILTEISGDEQNIFFAKSGGKYHFAINKNTIKVSENFKSSVMLIAIDIYHDIEIMENIVQNRQKSKV